MSLKTTIILRTLMLLVVCIVCCQGAPVEGDEEGGQTGTTIASCQPFVDNIGAWMQSTRETVKLTDLQSMTPEVQEKYIEMFGQLAVQIYGLVGCFLRNYGF